MTTKVSKLCNHRFLFVYLGIMVLKHYHGVVFRKKQPSNNSRFNFKHLKTRVIYKLSVPNFLHYSQFAERINLPLSSSTTRVNFILHYSLFVFHVGYKMRKH